LLCMTHPLTLEQIFNNLISDAIKFTQEGSVDILDYIMLTISNTGIGMRKEQTTTLFTPLFQADLKISRKYGGTDQGWQHGSLENS
ncbi:hypothetical protein BDK51DRAFT_24046, partial [Blyttiomyces helicus]